MTHEHSFAVEQGVWNYLQAISYSRSSGRVSPPKVMPDANDTWTIAISREAGIDAGAYARAISQQLGWPVWDHELLELIALRLGANVRELESLDERHVSWIQESIEAFLSLHSVSQHTFVRHLRETVEDLAALGHCVIVGRGSPHLLPAKNTLKIRLIAPMDARIAAFRQQMQFADASHAARAVEKIDRERVRFVREHFHADAADPARYDMVLNTSHISHADCARLALDFLQAAHHHPRPNTEMRGQSALAARH